MKTLFMSLSLLVIPGISGCDNSPALTQKDKDAIELEAESMLNEYNVAVKKSGLTAEIPYLDNSEEFFWVPPGFSGALSYDSVISILQANAGSFKNISNSFETLRVIPLEKNIATYTARIRSVSTSNTGKKTAVTLLETGTLIRRTDGWKLLSGQTTLAE